MAYSSVVGRPAAKEAGVRVGRYLAELRKRAGLTQSQVGRALGVWTVTVRRWELGIVSPSQENLEKVAGLYGVTVDEIMERATATASHVLHALPIEPKLEVIHVEDNAFEDAGILSGDFLLLNPDAELEVGRTYVVQDGSGEPRICTPVVTGDGVIRLRCYGDPQDLRMADCHVEGRVAWIVRRWQ